jgi:hypothetical protein
MWKRIINGALFFLLGVVVGLAIPPLRHQDAIRRENLRQMAVCERELQAMIPKLRAYALAHRGRFPDSDTELTRVIGKPLPSNLEYEGECYHLIKREASDAYRAPIICDKRRHYPVNTTKFQELILPVPRNRVHMLLNDLTIYHARDWKAFT